MKTRTVCLLLMWTALVAGCAADRPVPVTQTVNVPVPVPCVSRESVPARPNYEFDKLQLSASDGEKILALGRDWPRGRAYEGELEAIIAACAYPVDPRPLPTGLADTPQNAPRR